MPPNVSPDHSPQHLPIVRVDRVCLHRGSSTICAAESIQQVMPNEADALSLNSHFHSTTAERPFVNQQPRRPTRRQTIILRQLNDDQPISPITIAYLFPTTDGCSVPQDRAAHGPLRANTLMPGLNAKRRLKTLSPWRSSRRVRFLGLKCRQGSARNDSQRFSLRARRQWLISGVVR